MDINNERLPRGTCPQLFTKTLALNTEFRKPAEMTDYTTSSTAIFTCLQTMRPWGPDDADAHPSTCHMGRTCFCGQVEA